MTSEQIKKVLKSWAVERLTDLLSRSSSTSEEIQLCCQEIGDLIELWRTGPQNWDMVLLAINLGRESVQYLDGFLTDS